MHERPAAFGRRRGETARAKGGGLGGAPRLAPRGAAARERAQRVKRVVGDEPLPDEIPECVDGLAGIAAANRVMQGTEERRAARAEAVENCELAFGEVRLPVPSVREGKPDATGMALGEVRL